MLAVLAIVLVARVASVSDHRAVTVGRLGGGFPYDLPCFTVEPSGFRFRVQGPALEFVAPIQGALLQSNGRTEAVVAGPGGDGAPEKIRLLVAIPGVDVAFGSEMTLQIRGWDRAFLTWPGGSVGEGVPAPTDQRWLILSGSPASPCLAVCFSTPPCEVGLARRDGKLFLHAEGERLGWVRFLAPLGLEQVSSSGAGELGILAHRASPIITALADLPPTCATAVEWDRQTETLAVTEEWGLVPPRVGSLQPTVASIPTAEGPLLLVRGPAKYTLSMPMALVAPLELSRRGEASAVLQDARSTADLVRAYELRFALSDEDQQLLRNRLRSRADQIANGATWQEWIEPVTRQRLRRLAYAKGASLDEHVEAASLLLAALDWCGREDAWQEALVRCLAMIDLQTDWATLLPMPEGQSAGGAVLARCRDAAARALLLDWKPATAEHISYLAARLATTVETLPDANRPPLLLEIPPFGRLLRAEYDPSHPTQVRLKLAPGASFVLRGPEGSRIRGVEVDGSAVTVMKGETGKWSVRIPDSHRAIVVVIRIAPEALDATNGGRLVLGSLR